MTTIADIIAPQNTKAQNAIDFSFVKGHIASSPAFSTVFFGEELLAGLRNAEGYLQAQTLLTLLKTANNVTDFNYIYYCLKTKPNLKLILDRMRIDRYRLSIQSNVDDWSDDIFFYFNEDGIQFDPQAVKEFRNFN